MNKQEKIEDKFEKMMDDIDYKQYHIICNYIDLTVGEALVNQKQSILKAIMEAKPKEMIYEKLEKCPYHPTNYQFNCDCATPYNEAIKEFESVIKEVLK